MALFAREYKGAPAWLLPPEARGGKDALAAKRTLGFFAVAVFVLVVGAVFAFTVTSSRDNDEPPAVRTEVTKPAVDNTGTVDGIGPGSGADVGPYLDTRKQALAAATGERLAVVSFETYASEADARGKIASMPVEALLAAAPGAHPSVVTNGLEAWAKGQRQADEIERNEIQKLLPTVEESSPFKSFYESELVRLDAAIANVSPTSDVVFALVVRGSAEALKALATTPGVRLVDVGDAAKAEPSAVFKGLRPEETVKVGQPATRPL